VSEPDRQILIQALTTICANLSASNELLKEAQ
jgi:hypothetical protein